VTSVNGLFLFLVIPAAVVVSVLSSTRADANCRRHLEAWAAREGYVLERVVRQWMSLAFLFRGKTQRVYSVRAVGPDGLRRTGVARVGGYFTGSWSDEVAVRWDQ